MNLDTSLDLLRRWAAQEPDRCRENPAGHLARYLVRFEPGEYPVSGSDSRFNLAILLEALLQAIALHYLRVQLDNFGNGQDWTARLLRSHAPAVQIQATDRKAAIALLKAYVQWLEAQATTAGKVGNE